MTVLEVYKPVNQHLISAIENGGGRIEDSVREWRGNLEGTYTCNNINRNVNGTVIITVSNTSSLKSPSGSSSSLTFPSISITSGGVRSGSEA
jgi:hypothetical protein